MLKLKQKEGKYLKKSLPIKEKNKQEKIVSYKDKKEDPKKQSKDKHILNKNEIKQFINIIEDSPSPIPKKEGKKENYKKKIKIIRNKIIF